MMKVVMINTQFDTIQMDRRLHQSVMFNILLIKKEIPSLSYANKIWSSLFSVPTTMPTPKTSPEGKNC